MYIIYFKLLIYFFNENICNKSGQKYGIFWYPYTTVQNNVKSKNFRNKSENLNDSLDVHENRYTIGWSEKHLFSISKLADCAINDRQYKIYFRKFSFSCGVVKFCGSDSEVYGVHLYAKILTFLYIFEISIIKCKIFYGKIIEL